MRSAENFILLFSFLCAGRLKSFHMKKLITIFLLTFSLNAFSQDDPADGDGTVPLDGGLSLLLTAGAAYGIRRARQRRSH